LVPSNPHDMKTNPDAYFEWYVRHVALTVYHPVGTCSMGSLTNPMTVVDSELRVRGVSRLRVIDCAIMPTLPSANTNAPAIMVGERGADLIKAAWGDQKAKDALNTLFVIPPPLVASPTVNAAKTATTSTGVATATAVAASSATATAAPSVVSTSVTYVAVASAKL
jgi:hypothetical protein